MSKRAKLRSALIAYAVGDALGKGTEFMETNIIRRRYPAGLRRYDDIYMDAHRSQWDKGDWTNDTVVVLNMARGIIQDHGSLHLRHQASILHNWFKSQLVDVPTNVRWILSRPGYTEEPLIVSSQAWSDSNLVPSNEGLGRALLASLAPGNPETNAKSICSLTHNEVRCHATAILIGRLANDLFNTGNPTPRNKIIEIARNLHPSIVPYLNVAYNGRLEELELDDPDTLADTRKSAAAAIWTLVHCDTPAEAIFALTDAGGDSDTNAALGGALLALKQEGELDLPDHLVSGLKNLDQIEKVSHDLADVWHHYD